MRPMLAQLNPLILPESGDLARDPIRVAHLDVPGFTEAYDRHTLAYDVIHRPADQAIVLVCPKLFNFAQPLRAAKIQVDGTNRKIAKIARFRRYDEVWISCGPAPERIEIHLGADTLSAAISIPDATLAGRDVVIAKSKDNALDWIADWAHHYATLQRATGFVFFDNGSTDYGPADIEATLTKAAPNAVHLVVPANFRFGPTLPKVPKHLSKFFQAGILNVARHRFVGQSAGVVSVDIDEMIVSEQRTIFDEARAARLGYVTVPGFWRYARPAAGQMPRHSDHVWRFPVDRGCQEKWAVTPNSFLGRGGWDVHGVRGYHANKWVTSATSIMLHCERVTTGWKRKRQNDGPDLVPCPIASRVLTGQKVE
ncbi:hypothetical protein [Actibacterium sp. 188UL27-1]|uniref:hypothetical protein n=1 Tax=Actibacterium sp. 188UL27-1 TaxID=2786961 RepID=UPI00195AF82C|nr:hypothetical protein [Actibacterium sp. 188UL27-1]MBM7066767.1 hypothetical protein [Actibacterium sp. 188UL27-1]